MRQRAIAIALAAAVGAAVAAAASGGAAAASSVPFDVDFGVILPGESREAETRISVPAASTVTAAGWDAVAGAGPWSASLCSAAACTPVDELAGTRLDPGVYRIVVGIAMPDEAMAGRTSARGHVSLQEIERGGTGEGLAATGAALPWLAAIGGALAVGGGAALLVRLRRQDDEATS